MKTINFFCAVILLIALASCGGNKQNNGLTEGASGDMEAYEQGDVNAMEQARPQIMVIPATRRCKTSSA